MPQNPVLVYQKEGDTFLYMHTVDAAEAMRLGDYAPVPPTQEVSPEQRASAMSRFKTGQGATHPEMQTEEEKAATRQKANEEAEFYAGVPPGTPVVVQAPQRTRSGQVAGQQNPDHPHGGPPGQTGEHPEHPHGGPPGQTPPPAPTPTAGRRSSGG